MLSPTERAAVEEAANKGETAFAIEVIRSLARAGLLEKIPVVLSVFAEGVEMNQEPVRNFLAHRIPGILTNHYFPVAFTLGPNASGQITYQDFIDWSVQTEGWAEPIAMAARVGDPSTFVQSVKNVTSQIMRWKSQPHQSN